jgi:HEAT repeat protein
VARRTSAWLLTLSLVAILPPIIERRPNWGMTGASRAEEQTPAVTSLAGALQAADPVERARAACELGMRGTDAIAQIPSLIALLADDARVESLECGEHDRDGGNWTIGGEPQQCLTSPAREAARALSRIGTKAIQPLMTALGDVRATMRRYAAIALGMLDHRSDGPPVQRLVASLADSDWQVRRSVVWALGEVGTTAVVQPVAARLKDEHPRVREMAARGLSELEDQRSVSALIDAVKDSDWTVRREVVHALGELESRTAVATLADRLANDEHPRVRNMAAWALGEIEDHSGAPALRAALKDREPDVRKQAAWALGEIEDADSVDALVGALQGDESADARQMAAWALGEIENPKAVAGLVAALRDKDAEVRDMTAWALGEIESPAAIDALIGALKDTDWKVRAKAAWAIGEIADQRAAEALSASLKDEHPEVRKMAAWALAEVTDH